MKSSDPLLAAWRRTVARAKDLPAIFNTRGEVVRKFSEIEERARDFETKMEMFNAGSVIAIQIGNHEDWPSILIACLRGRLVVLPLEQSISDQQRDAALDVCRARAVVSVVTSGNSPGLFRLRTADATADWGEHPPSLLKLTSGTTAAPRAIRFRSEQLLADCVDLANSNATVFPGMPVFYQAFCQMENVPVLRNLRLCISAGAPLPIGVVRQFWQKFKLPIHSFYGASECGGICYDRDATNEDEGFVGQPMNCVDIEMVDPEASASQIRVRSPAVGDGYFPESDQAKLGGGLFVPDDLLNKTANGLRIVGRTSDMINVAGKKVNPAEVEAQLLRFSGVRQAIVFGSPAAAGALRNEEVAACVVAAPGISEAELLEFCRRKLSTWQAPKRVFIVDAVPVNERGKISRRELARRFAIGGDRSPLR